MTKDIPALRMSVLCHAENTTLFGSSAASTDNQVTAARFWTVFLARQLTGVGSDRAAAVQRLIRARRRRSRTSAFAPANRQIDGRIAAVSVSGPEMIKFR